MGVVVPNFASSTEDRASGAQVIDGSLKFDGTSQYLTRSFGSGNRKTWTWAAWVKRYKFGAANYGLFSYYPGSGNGGFIRFSDDDSGDTLRVLTDSGDIISKEKFRDTGWYHIVIAVDTTQGTDTDRVKRYVNGVRQTINASNTWPSPSVDLIFNQSGNHYLGRVQASAYGPVAMSQVYFIDGQALGPENFGYTDPLTNTWRPKKYTGEFNAAAIPGTTFDDATGGKPFVNTTDEGQTLGSGYVSGATTSAILVVPGYNLTEEGTSNSISNSGSATTVSNAKWYGTAIQFGTTANDTTTSECLSYGTALGLSGANNFTMEAWVYPRPGSSIGYNIIFEGDWQSNHGILFQLDGNRKPKLYFGDGGFQTFTSDLIVTADEWSHVAVVCDNNTIRFFVNGTMDTKGTRTKNYTVGNGHRFIGAYRDTNYVAAPRNPFYGYMQDIRVTNDAKYTSDFTVPGSGAVPAGVNGFYLPLDGSALIGEDKSGNGNDWTPVNFGGSNTIEKATGALPILNTDGGGKTARPGVFGSEVGAYYAVTVPSGIGGGYYLDGTQKPALSLIRGATYTFDQSDSSNSGHPLVFGTTADGNDYSDGVTTNGTPGSAGAYTKITVPHNAPDTLYYHCSAHGGMGSSTSQTTDTKKADPYAWKNVLALPLVGSKDDVSNRINSGSTAKTITVTNAVASSVQSNFYSGSYYFDGTGDYINASSNSDFTFGTGDFTIEGWIYPANSNAANKTIFSTNWGASGSILITYDHTTNKGFDLYDHTASAGTPIISTSGIYEPNTWYHIAVVRSSGTTKIYINGNQAASGSHSTDLTRDVFVIGAVYTNGTETWNGYIQDVRIYKGVAKYTSNFIPASTNPDILPDTPSGVAGGSALTKITDGAVSFDGSGDYLSVANNSDFVVGTSDFTMECYVYQTSQSSESTVFGLKHTANASGWRGYAFYISTGGALYWLGEDAASGDWDVLLNAGNGTISLNRWHHISATRDGTTFRLFIDGILQTSATSSVDLNDTGAGFYVGQNGYNTQYFNGFISNLRVIKGTALYTSNFTPPTEPLTNVTNTKLLCCQSTTSATAAAVAPGSITANGNAAATNFNPFTTDINAVRGQESGYATLSPLMLGSGATLSDGNTNYVYSSADTWSSAKSPFNLTSGEEKYYWEVTSTGYTDSNQFNSCGITSSSAPLSGPASGSGANAWVYDTNPTHSGAVRHNGSIIVSGTTNGAVRGDIISITFDSNTGLIRWYVNNVFSNQYTVSTGFDYYPILSVYNSSMSVNFGQKPFKFPPPEGFQPLNAANARPSTVIARSDQYVGVTTYSGNNTGQTINLGFQPDFVWIKPRSAINNALFDSVRGATKRLISNLTNSEDTISAVTAFNRDGFTLGGDYNSSGTNYVAWSWKAGGNSNTFNIDDVGYDTASAAGLTGGGYAVTGASVNTKSGFSIIQWEHDGTPGGYSMPHGLGRTPKFIITRNIDITSNWGSYHYNYDNGAGTSGINFNSTGAAGSNVGWWNNTGPTSSQFSLGTFYDDAGTFIAYLWAEIPGFSKFGSFTGNNSTDGPVIITGFRPKYVLIKCSSSEQSGNAHWVLFDSERIKYNPTSTVISVNLADRDYTSADGVVGIDILSNGFKLRDDNTSRNASATYVYAAFAEAPTFNLYGGQANAR